MGYYKDRACSAAAFSDDGSVLAVAFENILTLWDPVENHLCFSLDQGTQVTALEFCYGAQANCVVVATTTDVIIWDLLDYSGNESVLVPHYGLRLPLL